MKSENVLRNIPEAILGGLLAAWIASSFIGCGTVSPDPVVANQAAWVDGSADAGIVRFALDDQGNRIGLVVREGYVANYDKLVASYGSKIKHPVQGREGVFPRPDGLYYIDGQHAQAEMEMECLDTAAHGG